MSNTELLAPAGSFEIFKQALYNGADAIYLATDRFGARAYAKNLTMDELIQALRLAHPLNKKIYVTVNTILKENEIEDCKKYIKKLYEIGVDGIIAADFSIINFIINHCKNMEAHISTQVGLKDLNDVYFFEKLGAKRVVLAREMTLDEIKKIKESSRMPLEVFAHGALCVSYSGGCLFSSALSLRSGNRGRCSQNCRREYKLYEDDKVISKGFELSMRDLNTSYYLKDLQGLVDSLKIEGRMKDSEYVKTVVSEYRKKLDDKEYNPKSLESIFHRNYTKGFLFNEDKGKIVNPSKRTNEGEFIGTISNKEGTLTKIDLVKEIKINDRIRIADEEDYFFNIDKIYNLKNKETTSAKEACLLNIYKSFNKNTKIYRMVSSSIDLSITNKYKKPLTFICTGSINEPLQIETTINNITFVSKSNLKLSQALKKPIDSQTLTKQLSKLTDTSFYLDKLINKINGDLFITIGEINSTRRNLIEKIENHFQNIRKDFLVNEEITPIEYEYKDTLITAFCTTKEQYDACLECGIKEIYFDNYIPYVKASYNDIKGPVLVGNYGGIYYYTNKNKIVSDYSFNVVNSESIYYLHKNNVDVVTTSLELSHNELNDVVNSYKNKYKTNPNIEVIVYGHQNLMTLKYCPLRSHGKCGKCNDHNYYLEDSKAKFLTSRKDCITHIYNEKRLNLIDNLHEILKVTSRIRLNFTVENKNECIQVINEYKNKLKNPQVSYFNHKTDTRGYYKRPIF